jgi:hypothetical protein
MIAIAEIQDERERQDQKWGEQNHDAGTWALVLLEEIGEWAKAELHSRFGGSEAGRQRHEAVHAAAVAQAIVECMERARQKREVEKEGRKPLDEGFWRLQREKKSEKRND